MQTLVDGAGPRSTGELIRALAPWADVEVARLPHPVTAGEIPAGTSVAPDAPGAPSGAPTRPPGHPAAPVAPSAVAGGADVTPAVATSGGVAGAGAFAAEAALTEEPRTVDARRPAWPRLHDQAQGVGPEGPAPVPAPPDGPAAPVVLAPDEPGLSDLLAPPPPGQPAGAGTERAAVPAPPPPTPAAPKRWAPHRRGTQAEPPEFTEILRTADADETTPARHTTMTGSLARLGVVAAGASQATASSVSAGARRAAAGTRTAATAAKGGVAAALTAGRRRVREIGRPREERNLLPHQPYEDEVDGPEVPFKERRIDPTPVVLVGIGALVLVLLLVSMLTLFAPPEPVSLPTTTSSAAPRPQASPTPEPAPAAPAPAPAAAPVVASLTVLDPEGDGGENPALTPLALDGDPATIWRSRSYADPQYGMKSGVGLAIGLASPAPVSRVELDVNGTGGTVQVRATSPEAPVDGAVLAEGPMAPGTVLTFAEPVEADSLVLWFPSLPVADSDEKFRIELAEVRVG